jgi:6-pyruvoyltetrahydropterin/6-carboxytetrahydropterin synthase
LFTVTVETTFVASHQLTMYDGEKEQLHEHEWVVRCAVCTADVDSADLAIDFIWLKKSIDDIAEKFQNNQLEDVECFKGRNASAEMVAKQIFVELSAILPAKVELAFVEVMEEVGCWAKYAL